MTDTPKSGFETMNRIERCWNLEHEPPTHICVPYGQLYRHVCPGCGKTSVIVSNDVTLKTHSTTGN